MNKAAFFDIDGTIFRNSLLIEHFKILKECSREGRHLWKESIEPLYNQYKYRKGPFEYFIDKASLEYANYIEGMRYDYLKETGERLVKSEKDKIYLSTLNAINDLSKQGYLIFFISGSPNFLVDEFAKHFPVERAYSSIYKMKDGKFTGEVIPMWDSKSKIKAIKEIVEDYNIDLEESYAYGDTKGDLSMLNAVGNPYLVNPCSSLMNLCKGKEMKALIERKDLVYTLDLKTNKVEFNKTL